MAIAIEFFSIIIAIILALVGYLFTYFYNLHFTRRADKLSFIEKQINEFYGPLYVTVLVSENVFMVLPKKGVHLGMFFESETRVEKDIYEWRIWLENVLMPLNRQIVNIIVNKAHLIIEEIVPQCLRKLVAHVADYEVIVKKWSKGDFSEAISSVPFPDDLREYAEKSYNDLKGEQVKLLRKRY